MTINVPFTAVYASVIGKAHLAHGLPLQDACGYEWNTAQGWGIAIVCDGAGSCKHSDQGAQFCVKTLLKKIWQYSWKELMLEEQKCTQTIHNIVQNLQLELALYAFPNDVLEYACTLNVVLFSEQQLISFHIGDGRAGYCGSDTQWHAVMTPHKGEEANETLFITSAQSLNILEIRYVYQPIVALCVLSDGCEKACFQCAIWDEATQQYTDPNLPFAQFFNPNIAVLQQFSTQFLPQEEQNNHWATFLTAGNAVLERETDDKTLIFIVKK